MQQVLPSSARRSLARPGTRHVSEKACWETWETKDASIRQNARQIGTAWPCAAKTFARALAPSFALRPGPTGRGPALRIDDNSARGAISEAAHDLEMNGNQFERSADPCRQGQRIESERWGPAWYYGGARSKAVADFPAATKSQHAR